MISLQPIKDTHRPRSTASEAPVRNAAFQAHPGPSPGAESAIERDPQESEKHYPQSAPPAVADYSASPPCRVGTI